MGSVKRLVGAAVLAVISLLGWVMPVSADAAPVLPAASYSYDGVLLPGASADVHRERGPPLSTPVAKALQAVDRGSHGTLARPGMNSYTYNAEATPAKPATRRGLGIPGTLGATATTTGSGEVGDGELSSLPLSQVAANTGTRLARDVAVIPLAPRALGLNRSIGRTSHNDALQADIAGLPRGATDIRVNQQQVNALGQRVGINRPDLQYSLNGQRHYVEYEGLANPRGGAHQARLLANDPGSDFILRIVP